MSLIPGEDSFRIIYEPHKDEDPIELAYNELNRVMKEYQESDVCFGEFVENIHLNPRLSLAMQVNIYGELRKRIDDVYVARISLEDGQRYEEEVYGIS